MIARCGMLPRAALFTLAAALLASCDGLDGTTTTVAYSGRIAGYECSDYFMALRLDWSASEPARRRGGLACELGEDLVGRGCRFYVDEVFDPHEFRVVLIDCPFDLSETLFRCDFTEADVSAMNASAYAGCCFERGPIGGQCENPLPVCFTDETTGETCEICDNRIDDDDDGFVDCDDRACRRDPLCIPPTTTTTTTTASSVTTSSTTLTTLLPGFACDVRFRLVDTALVGSIRWKTGYSQVPGGFEYDGDQLRCESLVADAVPEFTDDTTSEELDLELVRTPPIEGPANLAECRFVAPDPVEPQDFEILEIKAATADEQQILPPPEVAVISVDCGPRRNESQDVASPAPQ